MASAKEKEPVLVVEKPNILILSAGFGDGHNAAARGLSAALVEHSGGKVAAPVVDLFDQGAPRFGAFLKWGYLVLTTHLTPGWKWLYHRAETSDPSRLGWDWFGDLDRALALNLAQLRPLAVVSTFPLYPIMMAKGQPGLPQPKRKYTVITDSISINSIWLRGPADRYFVTDTISAGVMERLGVAREVVSPTGFAVPPAFDRLAARSLEQSGNPFRVLYFATASARQVRRALESLLRDLPEEARLTVVMGRHAHRLGKTVRNAVAAVPGRSVEILGWTNQVPQLLVSHDLVISKGGGATVHECIATGTPILVNYCIPGQEEGNAELVQRRGMGWYYTDLGSVGAEVARLIASGAWREAKSNALRQRNATGALKMAGTILAELGVTSS